MILIVSAFLVGLKVIVLCHKLKPIIPIVLVMAYGVVLVVVV